MCARLMICCAQFPSCGSFFSIYIFSNVFFFADIFLPTKCKSFFYEWFETFSLVTIAFRNDTEVMFCLLAQHKVKNYHFTLAVLYMFHSIWITFLINYMRMSHTQFSPSILIRILFQTGCQPFHCQYFSFGFMSQVGTFNIFWDLQQYFETNES